ncbi:filamentous hemagglutinin N-terminal domain-containing protein [filamentous cyanobacterium LEGE 11480]|uniref:Filamentous hemagglutinin N-terminal domain-containing protein n=1 Tax=Romeriopsis navalis LEGE 11480 TaxID=2777977 RepID=A0A928VPU5_9CYAN|nr:filamentous hemagglutinin N-terminal domain-containing protein [Romeriopsis navalis]MBE9032563.1 filamentous hemagglutinin N-terminal domain-containing protein [Romeriopsis navalis LEGE 11480]
MNAHFRLRQLPCISIVWIIGYLAIPTPTQAQLIPDQTIGTTVQDSIATPKTQRISGGQMLGNSLFHSFTKFNIGNQQQVYFNNPQGIQNIFSRVTGNDRSNILGTLGVDGRANLFLLNPNGFFFGPNAKLDLSGSFTASAGNKFDFGNGQIFAIQTPIKQLLSTNLTPGLQYGSAQGDITNAANLSLKPKQTLTLFGNTIWQQGQLTIPSGIIRLLGNQLGLMTGSTIEVSGQNGGTVLLGGANQGQGNLPRANAVYIAPDSRIRANALRQGDGGTIIVWSENSTRVYGELQAQGGTQAGNGGLIETSSRTFLDTNSIRVSATATNGQPGTWLIDPRNIIIRNTPTQQATVTSTAAGNLFTPTGMNSIIDAQTINAQLNAGNNVTITTGDTGNQAGDIIGENFTISQLSTNPATLTLRAANNIQLTNVKFNPPNDGNPLKPSPFDPELARDRGGPGNPNRLNLIFEADSDRSGQGDILLNQTDIDTRGGLFQATTPGLFRLSASSLYTNNYTAENAAPLIVRAKDIIIDQGLTVGTPGDPGISVNTLGDGNGADVELNAQGELKYIEGTGIGNHTLGKGNAGKVVMNADTFSIILGGVGGNSGTSNVTTDINGEPLGRQTSFEINARQIVLDQFGFFFEVNGAGDGRPTVLNATDSITIGDGTFSAKVTGTNAIGTDIILNAQNRIQFTDSNSGITVRTEGPNTGPAGNIEITTKQLDFTGGISNFTTGNGNAGQVLIDVEQLNVDRGTISNSTRGEENQEFSGNAGEVIIKAQDSINLLAGSVITNNALKNTSGNTGNIDIETGNLSSQAGSQILITTEGKGNAGSVRLNASGMIALQGTSTSPNSNSNEIPSGIFNSIQPSAQAVSSGGITIQAKEIRVNDGASLTSGTLGNNSIAGNINLQADNVSFQGTSLNDANLASGISTALGLGIEIPTGGITFQVESTAFGVPVYVLQPLTVKTIGQTNVVGQSGNLQIQANRLDITQGARLSTATFASGNAGNIDINLGQNGIANFDGINSGALSTVESTAIGNGGSINIQAGQIFLKNGAQLSANTFGQGSAGTLSVVGNQAITIDGNVRTPDGRIQASGVYGFVDSPDINATGGNIFLNTPLLSLSNGGLITAAGQPQAINRAGNITVNAKVAKVDRAELTVSHNGSANQANAGTLRLNIDQRLQIDNSGALTANAQSGKGGDIIANINGLTSLRNLSRISAVTAGSSEDGNITITTPILFGIPKENSDIVATGQLKDLGNNITINAENILGLNFQPQLTENSDIVATGQVTLNLPDTDLNRGLAQLTTTPNDPSNRIDRSCQIGNSSVSSFVVTGGGGLPTTPTDRATPRAISRLATIPNSSSSNQPQTISSPQEIEIIEADQVQQFQNGRVRFISQNPTTLKPMKASCYRSN